MAGIACFALGVAVGQALGEQSRPGGTISYERTLKPVTVRPPARTVTVTTGVP